MPNQFDMDGKRLYKIWIVVCMVFCMTYTSVSREAGRTRSDLFVKAPSRRLLSANTQQYVHPTEGGPTVLECLAFCVRLPACVVVDYSPLHGTCRADANPVVTAFYDDTRDLYYASEKVTSVDTFGTPNQ
ncbi:uncharacterized protein LOC106176595 [Lingula anatina]|uniref:Uncharacterized protein LOC106167479 n=1 Tax=Lingula anatina TaxID=7574 RepID=A0A1S3JVV0_LINAN|nr:uncharacterized protein LOC106167479 [Lingula anatina]XP_013414518.1 uncharacterized protein LOC106176595 [Lingula anatina]|eukprot:XP_013401719.1 uncharacterized protein LOC106167479 [Lingula anatina]